MDFLSSYKLPDDITIFISTGRKSAKKIQQSFANEHQVEFPLPIRRLMELFTYIHHRMFFQASRNETANFKTEDLRDNLQCMIIAAAALCEIAYTIRHHQDFVRHQTRELLGHQA